MSGNDANRLGLLEIPNDNLEISRRRDHDILGSGMPLDLSDLALMSVQIDAPLVEILVEAVVADLPDLDGGVLGARGDLVVVERVPLEVEHRTAVACHFRQVDVDAARLADRYHDERPTAAFFRHDR